MNQMNDRDGITLVKEPDTFRFERFYSRFNQCDMYHWDYRDRAGVLHSGNTYTHEVAVRAAISYGYDPAVSTTQSAS